jgi:hypothetical protein
MRTIQKCPACGGVAGPRHFDKCPKVDRERLKRDKRVMREVMQRMFGKRSPL